MSTAAVQERVRAARVSRRPLRIAGASTWMDAGRPVDPNAELSLAGDRGIVEYVPGDLTLTARAGTPFDEIDRATRSNEQWLPLAPWGGSRGTLGATISTATAGPYAAAFGLPRDAALGVEFVSGAGDVVRAGGRVVKNVAGFDLTRLVTGSWGTLGVITEVTVRLRAIPQVTRTLGIRVDATAAGIAAMTQRLRALPFVPMAAELLNPVLSAKVGFEVATTLLVQLGGNATAVAAQVDLMRQLGAAADAPKDAVTRLREGDIAATTSWRVSGRPTEFARLWSGVGSPEALIHGSPLRGVIRVIGGAPAARAGTLVIEKAPATAWRGTRAMDALSETIRTKFDPDRILNPGILGAVA